MYYKTRVFYYEFHIIFQKGSSIMGGSCNIGGVFYYEGGFIHFTNIPGESMNFSEEQRQRRRQMIN